VKVIDRSQKKIEKRTAASLFKKVLSYALLAMIPVVIFELILFVAHLK